jgi:PIN domain nuclease of toxin-antitoxin system
VSATFLVDTHVFLWAAGDPSVLAPKVRSTIEDSRNEIFVSAAVAWELTIKYALGKLQLPVEPATYFPSRLRNLGFKALPITHDHALGVGKLPRHHNDPFDRIMIAQAQLEGLVLITADESASKYAVHTLAAIP